MPIRLAWPVHVASTSWSDEVAHSLAETLSPVPCPAIRVPVTDVPSTVEDPSVWTEAWWDWAKVTISLTLPSAPPTVVKIPGMAEVALDGSATEIHGSPRSVARDGTW